MKKKICGLLMVIYSIFAFLPSSASAIKVKLRLDLPLGGSYSVNGLESFVSQGGFGLGLGVLIPYDQDMDIETGYEYSSVRFNNTSESYKGSYTSHFLKLGGSYFGLQITDSYRLLTGATFDLPLAGQAEVTRKSDQESQSSSDFGGWGIYANAGITNGNMDYYLFYDQRKRSYGLTPPGKSEKLSWTTSQYGLGVGFTF
jgi:opacity protein-like surface antigen